jgi:hypothetical protein
VIQGYASLLEDHLSESSDEAARQWAHLVGEEVDVLNALLTDLSRWTSLTTAPPKRTPVRLREVLAEVAQGIQRATAAELTVVGEDVQLNVDQQLLTRALSHLARPFGSKPVVTLSVLRSATVCLRLESAVVAPEVKAQDPWLTYARAVVLAHGGDVAWDVRGATVTLPLALAE